MQKEKIIKIKKLINKLKEIDRTAQMAETMIRWNDINQAVEAIEEIRRDIQILIENHQ